MPYTDASGVQIPVGTDSFSPTSQFKTWQDKNATYNYNLACDIDSERTALASPVLRDGLTVYVKGTKKTWQYQDTTWVDISVDDTGWTALALQNLWVNFDGGLAEAAYRRVNGIVYLRGTIKSGSLTSGTLLFTLPAGFRPASTLRFMLLSNTSNAVGHLTNAGTLVFSGAAPSNASLSLDTVRFVAEQ